MALAHIGASKLRPENTVGTLKLCRPRTVPTFAAQPNRPERISALGHSLPTFSAPMPTNVRS